MPPPTLSKAIECQPANWISWADRGKCPSPVQQWDKAIADYSKSIERELPGNGSLRPAAQTAIRNWANGKKRPRTSAKFVELKPEDAEAWLRSGQAYGHLGQWDRAVADYLKAIAVAKDNDALATLIRNRLDADFAKALQAKASRAVPLDRPRPALYAELKHWSEAAADFARTATLKDDDPFTCYEQAMAYLAAGELPAYRRVCADMIKRFGPDHGPAVSGPSDLHVRDGES